MLLMFACCRRAPIQLLDMNGRTGLLRTVLEAQETRGLTRSGDISRLLPAGVGRQQHSKHLADSLHACSFTLV